MRKLDVFDTTLRDGEQAAGVNLHRHEKVEIALQIERYGVDIMEAGFPASSEGDFRAVQEIARQVKNTSVAGMARANQNDIDIAWEALGHGVQPRLHIFLATSPIHMEYKLRLKPAEVVEVGVQSIAYAAKRFPTVEWSAEDCTRSDWDFLVHIVTRIIDAGAKVINLPDTVGYTTPQEYANLFRYIQKNVPNLDGVKLSAHCHDDLGMAVANTLSAVEAGVHQVEGTINGIGERAGNASLEEILVSLQIRNAWYGVSTGVNLEETARTSELVSRLTGMPVPPNKAIVGANAFAHESGIHQDGVLKNRETYEIIRPELVGYRTNKLVLGKHSGRHAFREACDALGYTLSPERFQLLFQNFKTLTETQKDVSRDDISHLLASLPEEIGSDVEELTS